MNKLYFYHIKRYDCNYEYTIFLTMSKGVTVVIMNKQNVLTL